MRPEWFAGQDFQLERSDSLRFGMNAQLWPIHDSYVLEGVAIKPRGKQRLYFPMSEPRLPFELAKVPDGDREAALGFVRKWGLLGRASLLEDQAHRGEDTLVFVWGHAATIRDVLVLFMGLQDGRQVALEDAVNRVVRQMPIEEGSDELKQCCLRMEGAKVVVSAQLKPLSPEDLALKIIADSISKNLEGAHPVVEALPWDNEQSPDSILTRLQFTFRYQALVQCAYWHLAMLVSNTTSVAQCLECSGFFVRTDKRQQFCPPTQEEINQVRDGTRSRVQSRCALRNRTRRNRQKGRELTQTSRIATLPTEPQQATPEEGGTDERVNS